MMLTAKLQLLGLCLLSCSAANLSAAAINPSNISYIKAHNPLATARIGAATLIPVKLLPGSNASANYLTEIDSKIVANQWVDTNGDGANDSLLLVADYAAKANLKIKVTLPAYGQLNLQYPALTQTEMGMRIGGKVDANGLHSGGNYFPVSSMTLPPTHTIGDKLFKYEGFGWESDRIAYRFYFDERGLVDIFGKRTPELLLERVGLDQGDYHTLSDWGMDILKVGPSLGLGGLAAWVDEKVVHPKPSTGLKVNLTSGALESTAEVTQSGWQLGTTSLDLTRKFSIRAHSNLTYTQVNSTAPLGTVAIGIVKHGVDKLEQLSANSEWNYLATYGTQSLANDNLGMVVFFRHSDLVKVSSDEFNELAILRMKTSGSYYFAARWQGEIKGTINKAEFSAYLEQTRAELNKPIKVSAIKN